MTSIEEQNLQIVKEAYASSARGEPQGFTASFTSETEIHEAPSLPYGGIHKGVQSFPSLIGKVLEHFSSLKFTKHNIIASGDNVVSWGVLDLVGKKTEKSVSIPLVEIWTIVDGKTQKLQVVYGDTAEALRAADLI
ncbi:nuclear transport factor 2 family protein [Rhizorhabdus argentea]|uniref:nuclear transport factor 2 family protein n=1 Tax=Rhizorhabdus argentea TaxID=1387174 RepID=UPI0030EC77B0